ncbi:MAG: tetratricopeptide repeat protein [Planctomycetes bacterium]|nr:tetratricopeptide repeat protein [Planctomycetota bacterium]
MPPEQGPRRRTRSRDPQIIREEVLRPSHYLGYDRDEMGCYFLGREAFELAESQFRRAVWLNPYEATFKTHWAIALIRLDRMAKAQHLLEAVLRDKPDDRLASELWSRYWPGKARPKSGASGADSRGSNQGTE